MKYISIKELLGQQEQVSVQTSGIVYKLNVLKENPVPCFDSLFDFFYIPKHSFKAIIKKDDDQIMIKAEDVNPKLIDLLEASFEHDKGLLVRGDYMPESKEIIVKDLNYSKHF
jgi:hypothetical protein